MRAIIEPVFRDDDVFVIRDAGEGKAVPSVTNDAEAVVEHLVAQDVLGGRTLLYYDSMGQLSELRIRRGKFAGYRGWMREPYWETT